MSITTAALFLAYCTFRARAKDALLYEELGAAELCDAICTDETKEGK